MGVAFYYLVKKFLFKNKLSKKSNIILVVLSILVIWGTDEYRFYYGSKEVGSIFQRGTDYSKKYYAKTQDKLVIANLFVDNSDNDFTNVYVNKLIFPDGKKVYFNQEDNLDIKLRTSQVYLIDTNGKEWELTITKDMVKE
jgi:hypothetical protein